MTRSFAIVDTNVVSYLFRKDTRARPYEPILGSFQGLGISFQTLAELQYWAARHNWGRRRRADLMLMLQRFDVILCDERTCDLWAAARRMRERRGRPIQPEDAWIAATALDVGCPLITHDPEDFADINGLKVFTATTS